MTAIDFAIASSVALNVGMRLLESVAGGHIESGFSASRPGLLGPGMVRLQSTASAGAIAPAVATAAAAAAGARWNTTSRRETPSDAAVEVEVVRFIPYSSMESV